MDSYPARYLLGDCIRNTTKLLVYGAIEEWGGQRIIFAPSDSLCYRDLYSEPHNAEKTISPGVIGATAGVIGSIQASQMLRLILRQTPALLGELLIIDLWHGSWYIFGLVWHDPPLVIIYQPQRHIITNSSYVSHYFE